MLLYADFTSTEPQGTFERYPLRHAGAPPAIAVRHLRWHYRASNPINYGEDAAELVDVPGSNTRLRRRLLYEMEAETLHAARRG